MKAQINGIQSLLAAKVAEEAGADYLGFVFDKNSDLYIEPDRAAVVSSQIRNARRLGTFVDAELDTIRALIYKVHLDYVEFCGHEPPELARALEVPLLKYYRYGVDFSVQEANEYPSELVVLDLGQLPESREKRLSQWQSIAAETAKLRKSFFITGNLEPRNVREIERTFHPYGVSVARSLRVGDEESIEQIKAFLKKVR